MNGIFGNSGYVFQRLWNKSTGAPQGRGVVAQGDQPWVRIDKPKQP